MTALRPEHEAAGHSASYGQDPSGAAAYGGERHEELRYSGSVSRGGSGAQGIQGTYVQQPLHNGLDQETVGLRLPDPLLVPAPAPEEGDPAAAPMGRAERRRAAARRTSRRGRRRRRGPAQPPAPVQGPPGTRMEARRAAREQRESLAMVASRVIGELFITLGVVMLLFVTYQLWWTNVRAQAQANGEASSLQENWASGERAPGAFEPGQGFAIMHIPKLDVVVPIAEGIDKKKVLDRGMVGHYAEGELKTAMPEDKKGNFAVAGHRNTHGEPFRYINRLRPGDPIVVETQEMFYVYEMTSILAQTPPSNTSVIDPVPQSSGFTKPGRYITLTTCTPEFTSTYRMIVWGKMVEERPRSKGKPDALVGG
jgi:sortase A